MEFFERAPGNPGRLGILPGTFNPVTIAHLAIAEAALSEVDEVVFVLPRQFPHKEYAGATFEERISMLRDAARRNPAFSVATSEGGLYAAIAAECRAAYGGGVRLACLCGRDAAERILSWDYGCPGFARAMLRDFELLVAARAGEYSPPPELAGAVRTLPLAGEFDHVSASEVRRRIAAGIPCDDFVPAEIRAQVRRIYRTTGRRAPD